MCCPNGYSGASDETTYFNDSWLREPGLGIAPWRHAIEDFIDKATPLPGVM